MKKTEARSGFWSDPGQSEQQTHECQERPESFIKQSHSHQHVWMMVRVFVSLVITGFSSSAITMMYDCGVECQIILFFSNGASFSSAKLIEGDEIDTILFSQSLRTIFTQRKSDTSVICKVKDSRANYQNTSQDTMSSSDFISVQISKFQHKNVGYF